MNNRRTFLKTACKPLVLAAIGISVIEACSKEDNENNPIIKARTAETCNIRYHIHTPAIKIVVADNAKVMQAPIKPPFSVSP